jgi:SPX domain protein involved in polyphosphate accumulation
MKLFNMNFKNLTEKDIMDVPFALLNIKNKNRLYNNRRAKYFHTTVILS